VKTEYLKGIALCDIKLTKDNFALDTLQCHNSNKLHLTLSSAVS
jgi:hypothetical protein